MARSFNTPPLQLDLLTLHPRHHRAALWWLGWLYRNPVAFKASLEQLPPWPAIRTVARLYLHALPYLFLFAIVGQVLLFHAGLAHPEWGELAVAEQWFASSTEAVFGLVVGLVVGLVLSLIVGLDGLRSGLVGSLVVGLVLSLVVGLDGLRSGLIGSLVGGLGGFVGVRLGYCRPYYLGLHALFWFFRHRPALYRFHPASWDWLCLTPFP
jgi:hypothetical protein